MTTMETKWVYNGKIINSIDDMPSNSIGFVYQVTHTPTGRKYIGKKVLYFNRKKKLTKKELLEHTGKGRKPTHKRITTESDWKTYYGSNPDIKKMLKEGKTDEFQREILYFCKNKKELTYMETKYLFINEVLEYPEEFWNDNILGKFFTKDFK